MLSLLLFVTNDTCVCWEQYSGALSVWDSSSLWCWGFVCAVFLFLLCFSVLPFSNILQIHESLVTVSVESMDWIIQCLGKFIQNSREVRVFAMYLSKPTTSQKLLFVLLSQCGDLCLKLIYSMHDTYSRWCLTCFFLASVFFHFLWNIQAVFHSWL